MFSDIGFPPLSIEPATCTVAARVPAASACASTRAGARADRPLPEEEPPQPAIAYATSDSAQSLASAGHARVRAPRRIALSPPGAVTVSGGPRAPPRQRGAAL